MIDARVIKLAQNLVNYSCEIRPGEKVLIEASGPTEIVEELVKAVYQAGGLPFVNLKNNRINRLILNGVEEDHLALWADVDAYRMAKMDAYIGVRGVENEFESSDIPQDRLRQYESIYQKPVHMDIRVEKTKWVILKYPTPSFAQLAAMSSESFEDFFFKVCNLDYSKMSKAMDPLVELIEKTDRVHIKGPETNLTFSVKGIGARKCDGQRNIPDGEVFTAPVKNSIEGYISYNTPAIHQGFRFEKIRFEFSEGKIVKATANDTVRLNKILDTDPGARYIGEFAMGMNPWIKNPMMDALFDEKIDGSLHLTPGGCYSECSNGNDSAIHWDLVLLQKAPHSSGEIFFDDRLIRKDGDFIPKELQGLNPDNLI